jgi:hypothetical protein
VLALLLLAWLRLIRPRLARRGAPEHAAEAMRPLPAPAEERGGEQD